MGYDISIIKKNIIEKLMENDEGISVAKLYYESTGNDYWEEIHQEKFGTYLYKDLFKIYMKKDYFDMCDPKCEELMNLFLESKGYKVRQ